MSNYLLIYPSQSHRSTLDHYEWFEELEKARKFRDALKDPNLGGVRSKVKIFEVNLIDEI